MQHARRPIAKPSRDWADRPDAATIALGAVLLIAVAFGGGGVRYAFANLAVQLAALTALAFHREAFVRFWKTAPLPVKSLVALSMLLPVIQLIPLPPAIWQALPGRELVAQSFELTGRSGWAAASVDPVRTTVAMTGLIAPMAVLTIGWKLSKSQLVMIAWLVVALGLANVLIGIPQVLGAGASANFYAESAGSALLNGTFANRNSTGIFLIGALILAILLPAPRPHPAISYLRIGLCALLVVAIVLTRSRTAFVLMLIPFALAALRIYGWSRRAKGQADSRTLLVVVGAVALAAAILAAAAAIAPGRVGDTMERFERVDDARVYIWEDAAFSVTRYWPVGAGMGTFDEVFQLDESLENNTERRAGRAHNDYIEVAIEAGFAGLTLIALWLIAIGWLCWKARISSLRWAAWGAGALLLTIALQSITDYPLRNQTMLSIASFALLLLARIATDPHAHAEEKAP